MAKRRVRTFHPLAVAKSLEAQNEAVGLVLSKLHTIAEYADRISPSDLVAQIQKLGAEGEIARRLLWPEESE